MARPVSELRVRAAVVEARRKYLELGLKQMGVARGTYRGWLHGRPITLLQAESLAERLGIGVLEIVDGLPDGYATGITDPDEAIAATSRELHDRAVTGGLIAESHKFRSYLRHIGLRFVAPRGFCRHFQHVARERHYYAEIVLTPLRPGDNVYTFSYELGPLRIDYGTVQVAAGVARLRTHFAPSSESPVTLSPTHEVRVWTWFGRDACRFLVRATRDFGIRTHLEPANRDPDARPAGVVCFRAAPHHESEARER